MGRATSRSALRVHFVNHPVWDIVVILEEGIHPTPRCPKCYIIITWRDLNGRYQATEMCYRGEERIWKQWREEEVRRSTAVTFQAYGRPGVDQGDMTPPPTYHTRPGLT